MGKAVRLSLVAGDAKSNISIIFGSRVRVGEVKGGSREERSRGGGQKIGTGETRDVGFLLRQSYAYSPFPLQVLFLVLRNMSTGLVLDTIAPRHEMLIRFTGVNEPAMGKVEARLLQCRAQLENRGAPVGSTSNVPSQSGAHFSPRRAAGVFKPLKNAQMSKFRGLYLCSPHECLRI